MTTYDIPREQWRSFFDQFSRLHQGQAVNVQTEGKGANARGIPLLGITAEGDRVDITGGDIGGILLDHAIDHPLRIKASEWNDGISAALEIESRQGRTRVQVGPEKE